MESFLVSRAEGLESDIVRKCELAQISCKDRDKEFGLV